MSSSEKLKPRSRKHSNPPTLCHYANYSNEKLHRDNSFLLGFQNRPRLMFQPYPPATQKQHVQDSEECCPLKSCRTTQSVKQACSAPCSLSKSKAAALYLAVLRFLVFARLTSSGKLCLLYLYIMN